jgi:hypothetical protein
MVRRAAPIVLTTMVTALVLAVAGCGHGSPTSAPPPGSSGTTTGSSSSPSASPSNSAAPAVEFTVDGAGPYTLGAKLTDLQAAGKLANVTHGSTDCSDIITAQGIAPYAGVLLSFHSDNTLYAETNTDPGLPTPSGAYIGTNLTQLKTIYAKTTNETLNHGTSMAFMVITISGRSILFILNEVQNVSSMVAGDSLYLRQNFVNGTPFC